MVYQILLVACGDPAAEAGQPSDELAGNTVGTDGDVGQVAQELGSIRKFWEEWFEDVGPPLHIGPTHVVFSTSVSGCWGLSLVSADHGHTHVPTPDCSRPLAIVTDPAVFASISGSNDIVVLSVNENWEPVLVRIADTRGNTRGKMMLSASHVFWADSGGIGRVPRSGGSVTRLSTDSTAELVGLEGSTLYYTRLAFGVLELRRMTTSGGSDTLLYIGGSAFQNLSFDASHFYWVDNVSSPMRVRRLPKAGGRAETFASSMVNTFHHPRSTGSFLYVVEDHPGSTFVVRRSLTTGASQTSNALAGLPADMNLTSSHVYTAVAGPPLVSDFGYAAAARGPL